MLKMGINVFQLVDSVEKIEKLIPKSLRDEKLRFVKVRKSDKKPIGENWSTTNNFKYHEDEFIGWVSKQSNYGVVGGFGGLLVIDFDCSKVQENVLPKLPESFTVKSGGKGLYHVYYYIDDASSFNLKDENKKTLVDFQGTGRQVVGPGSLHRSGGVYKVVKDIPINTIKRKDLLGAFSDYLPTSKIEKKHKCIYQISSYDDEVLNEIKDKVYITQYDPGLKMGLQICKFHQDKSPSLSVFENGRAFKCFSGCGHGDIFSYVMLKDNCDFPTAKNLLMEFAGIKQEKRELIQKYKKEETKGTDNELIELRQEVKEILGDETQSNKKAWLLIANYVKSKEKVYTIRSDLKEEIWIYKNGVFVPDAQTYIKEIVFIILGANYTQAIFNDIIRKIQVMTYINENDFFINEDVNLIPLRNGIFNLKEKKLTPFSKKYRFFNRLPVTYDKDKKCPNIIKFFADVLKTTEDVMVIQELIGYMLLRRYKFEKAFMFLGNGRNGKSKAIDVIKRFLGPENCCNLSLKTIERERNFELAQLQNKLANLSGDISKAALDNTGTFKSLTGRDLITAERKFLTSISFVNYSKMLFSCNELPETNDLTDGFFNRWIILDFPFRFVPEREMKVYNKNEKKEVPNIIEKICSQEELDGLFNWALEGLERLNINKGFTKARTGEQIKTIWLRKSSSIHGFIFDKCEKKHGSYVKKDDFRDEYSKYCSENKVDVVDDKKIYRALTTILGVGTAKKDNERVWNHLLIK
jgi:putative DNA primase/helicase